jgi:PhnB protein
VNYLAPALTVSDLKKSLHFYREVLGFDEWFQWQDDEGKEASAGVARDSVRVILDQETDSNRVDGRRGMGVLLYVDMGQDDVDAYFQRVKSDAAVVSEPKDQPWGDRSFIITDPDGYEISFAKALSQTPA